MPRSNFDLIVTVMAVIDIVKVMQAGGPGIAGRLAVLGFGVPPRPARVTPEDYIMTSWELSHWSPSKPQNADIVTEAGGLNHRNSTIH